MKNDIKQMIIKKTIVLSQKTHKRLGTYARLKGETFEEIIIRLMNCADIVEIKAQREKEDLKR